MATIDITPKFLNQNKRYSEAVVVTVPSILSTGGGRSQAQPIFIQGGDALTAQVIEANTLIKKVYLNVTEAFPAGALLNVDIAGTQYFVAVDGTSASLTVSTTEDVLLKKAQTVTITVTGVTGDVTTGRAEVIFDVIHSDLTNGQFTS